MALGEPGRQHDGVADEQANDEAFGRPGASRGSSAYPQFRFVSLVERGTHVLFGTRMAPYATGENTLAKDVLSALDSGSPLSSAEWPDQGKA